MAAFAFAPSPPPASSLSQIIPRSYTLGESYGTAIIFLFLLFLSLLASLLFSAFFVRRPGGAGEEGAPVGQGQPPRIVARLVSDNDAAGPNRSRTREASRRRLTRGQSPHPNLELGLGPVAGLNPAVAALDVEQRRERERGRREESVARSTSVARTRTTSLARMEVAP
ncbi:hypothetical protein SLS62_006165 [Diatrype stigma]|uniref:Uncharacterized protein n=1 Tax=Diatrype stigma TaxID=117547 RepID=A0AAN9YRV3_9PEZI